MKKTSEATLSSLPEEIQVDIFLRLPVSSILICRRVCKFLRTLLLSPSFIKDHFNLTYYRNSNDPKLMFTDYNVEGSVYDPTMYSINCSSISSYFSLSPEDPLYCECNGAVQMNYPLQYKEGKYIEILGSCNGLICMGISIDYDYTTRVYSKRCICIWNPTTGEYKEIPLPLSDSNGYSVNSSGFRYGFGYDRIIDDYKVVRISKNSNLCFEVYTLGSSTWNCTEAIADKYFRGERSTHGLLFSGALHWLGTVSTSQGTSSEVVMCFDISNATVFDVPLPEENTLHQGNRTAVKNLGMLRDCLCLLNFSHHTEIWVLQESAWTKKLAVSYLALSTQNYPIWSLENGEILVNEGCRLVLFYPSNGTMKSLQVRGGIDLSKLSVRETVIYMESLVSLNTGTYVQRS